MSNVISFPQSSVPAGGTHPAEQGYVSTALLAEPRLEPHSVQFYETDDYLIETASRFLEVGLHAGERLLIIATPEHREAFQRRLIAGGGSAAIANGFVVTLDAESTLAKFMIGDSVDCDLFHDLIERTIAGLVHPPERTSRVRAYGEMVDLLWKSGNAGAAVRLEELWNQATRRHPISLLCAYAMANFEREGDASAFYEVCRSHSHVQPSEAYSRLDDATSRLREISLLQQRARALETEIQQRKELELALRDALKERARIEGELRDSLFRETTARQQAEANDAFKEVFLGILGHDLRNPLSTILTTARLMTMGETVSAPMQKRIDRVVSSGVRMQRMITQLLDVTQARLASGIPVHRQPQELAPIVAKIVDETRAAHPERLIELKTSGSTALQFDADRVEQVISNLLGNAVLHGDPERAITVSCSVEVGLARLSVHNWGPSIDPELLPKLFDPFLRGSRDKARSEGLGLGLYISERIITAHGGQIRVESSQEGGTRFEVVLPT